MGVFTHITDGRYDSPYDQDTHIEITRSSGKVTIIDEWDGIDKTKLISSTALTRQGAKVTHIVKSIYDYATGSGIIATVTGTIYRTEGKVSSIVFDRNDVEGI